MFFARTGPTSPSWAYFDLFSNTNVSGLLSINIGNQTQVSTGVDIRGTTAIVDVIATTTVADIYVNGTQTNNNIARGPLSLNNDLGWSISGGAFIGYVGEIIAYPSEISDLQRQQIEGYLAWKWGLQDNLPDSQPYKNAPPISLDAPVIAGITGLPQSVRVDFTQTTGGLTITNYQYSTDNGATFRPLNTPDITSPLTISTLSSDGTTPLTNGVTYDIIIQAKTENGLSPVSNMVQGRPSLPPPPTPTALSSVGGNQAAYILFNQSGTVTNYEYSTDDGATYLLFNPPQIYSPVTITSLSSDGVTPLINGTTYTVKLKAVNSGASSTESLSVNVTPTITSLETNGRIIYLDANNSSSYPGSGTSWTNLASSGSYSATLIGTPTFDDTTEPGNKYFAFNSGATSGQYSQINQATAINPVFNAPFTIQIWARINNVGSYGSLVSKMFYQAQDYDGYNFIYGADLSGNNNFLQLHLNGSSQDIKFVSIKNILNSEWVLYTANIQFGNQGGRQNKIFVNGRQVLSATSNEGSIPRPNQNLTFPAGFGGDGRCDIGEFYYYNTELTTTQIIQNFDATKSRYM